MVDVKNDVTSFVNFVPLSWIGGTIASALVIMAGAATVQSRLGLLQPRPSIYALRGQSDDGSTCNTLSSLPPQLAAYVTPGPRRR